MSEEKILSEDGILKVAHLARLAIAPDEITQYTKDINAVLGYVRRLQEVDVSKIEGMSHVHGSTNVFRNDKVKSLLKPEDVLRLAPDSSGRFIRVPLIIDQEQP